MTGFFDYLRNGLSRKSPPEKIPNDAQEVDDRSNLGSLWPYFVRHWRKGVGGALLLLFSNLLIFPQPLINRFLVDEVILGKNLNLLPLAVILIAGVKLLSMGLNAIQQYTFTRFQQAFILDMQQDLLDHTLRLPKTFFDDKELGYLISRLSSDIQGLRWFFSSNIVFILSSIIQFLGGLVFLFYLEWRLALVALLVLPVLIISTRFYSGRLRILSQHGMERDAGVLQRFEETLASIPLIKAFTSEKRESRRIISAVAESQQIEMEQTTVNTFADLVINSVPDLARAFVLAAGAYLVIQGQWTLGSLLAFQSYLGYIYGPALSLSYVNLQLQQAMTALTRVSNILQVIPEDNTGKGMSIEHLNGSINFEDVSFSYDGQDIIFKDISFTIQPGEHIAIVGPSGVGKTTLISLILRFYLPSSGRILFDNRPAGEYELNSLRQRIGYVSQSIQILAGSIRDNLVYGNPQISQTNVEIAAKAAGIHDSILDLPEGYDSLVGERGINLSEGQKQRISIARALIKSPDILILDEPTSALDNIIEQSIFKALPSVLMDKTLIIASHRLSTIQQADKIMLFKEKHLVEIGSHADLMLDNEYYRSMFQAAQP